MITINDNDLPITAAEKIITGTKQKDRSAWSIFMKAVALQEPHEDEEDALAMVNMFSLEEIEEIAHYLILYCEEHKKRLICTSFKNMTTTADRPATRSG